MNIRAMKDSDWPKVAEIYEQALLVGKSTFNTECPTFEAWDRAHHKDCRIVAEEDGNVVGWIVISPTSARPVYRGVVEVSVYVDQDHQGKGIGKALMDALIKEAKAQGYWCLYSAIFAINEPSLRLHRACGFREIGYRDRIAIDRFGNWQSTILMENRF